MKRSEFLGMSASAGVLALINAHAAFAAGSYTSKSTEMSRPGRIRSLRLLTTTPFPEMKKFYAETIGLPVSEKKGELIVTAGETIISFIKGNEAGKRPFYHFAFNIPENKIKTAFEWQRKRTPVIHPNPAGEKDSIVNFAHWNAHSIFFLDPAGNLLEYIARHDLKNATAGDFSVNDILYASEIGLIVDDVAASGNDLQKTMGLTQYKDETPGFWPIGDETGLLLMIRKGRVWSGHPGKPNETDFFKTVVGINGIEKRKWMLPGYPYEIISI
jgi:hypothetical protein